MLSRLLWYYVTSVASHTSTFGHTSALEAGLFSYNDILTEVFIPFCIANLVRFNTVQSPLMLLNKVLLFFYTQLGFQVFDSLMHTPVVVQTGVTEDAVCDATTAQ